MSAAMGVESRAGGAPSAGLTVASLLARRAEVPPTPSPSPSTSSPDSSLITRPLSVKPKRSGLHPVMEGEVHQEPVYLYNTPVSRPASVTRMRSTPTLGKKRSNFFREALQEADLAPERNRVRDEAIVAVDVKTNVMISDELTFMTQFSSHLSARYGRPVTSIAITLQHGVCMLFGGTFEPAYVVTIKALPQQVQSTTNKRNVALLQKHLQQALGVGPARGFVAFTAVPEECFGWNASTVTGELEDLERRAMPELDEYHMYSRAVSKATSARGVNPMSPRLRTDTPDVGFDRMILSSPGRVPDGQNGRTVRNKRSFIQTLFQRSSRSDAESANSSHGSR